MEKISSPYLAINNKMFNFPSPKTTEKWDYRLQRSLEILPGVITWFFLIFSVYLSFKAPIAVAVFIIIFDLYWMVKVFYITTFAILGYRRMRIWGEIDWLEKCEKFGKDKSIKNKTFSLPLLCRSFSAEDCGEKLHNLPESSNERFQRSESVNWRDIYHLVIFPTYKEGLEILEPSLNSILNSIYPKDRIILVAAFEERGGDRSTQIAKILEEKFKDKFFAYLTTFHPDGIAGEAKVKGANASWAAEEARIFLGEKKISCENVVVSTFDSDTCVHPQYFACLAYRFLTNPKRHQCSYQPLPLYNNNIWQTNSVVRVIMTSSSFWQIMQSMRFGKMVTFSSHSMSFKTLVDVDYWPRDMISDDSIIFWKCYCFYYGDYYAQPIYLPVSLDAVLSNSYWKTVLNQYRQQRRWAWGIENIPIIYRAFLKNKKIPLLKKISRGWEELSGRISWGLTPVIIAFFGWLPIIFGGERFNQTILALKLPKVLGYLMTFSMFGLVISMFLSLLLLPPPPFKAGVLRRFTMVLQWILAPLIAIPLGAFPMIDAQTRMMLGKYMEFQVTEKVRK